MIGAIVKIKIEINAGRINNNAILLSFLLFTAIPLPF